MDKALEKSSSSLTSIPVDSDLTFPHIITVDASAGSGKTYLLALRFIQYLLSDKIPRNQVHNLLAITFTNEAASQMRQRILELLKQAAFEETEVLEAISRLLDLPERHLSFRALETVDRIIRHYDRWQVRTIDSFIHRLVLSAPQELGIGPKDQVQPNHRPFLQEAFDRLTIRSSQDKEALSALRAAVRHYVMVRQTKAWWPSQVLLDELTRLHDLEGTHGLSFSLPGEASGSFGIEKKIIGLSERFLELSGKKGLKLRKDSQKALEEAVEGRLESSLKRAFWQRSDVSGHFLKGFLPDKELSELWKRLIRLCEEYVYKRAIESAGPIARLLSLWKQELKEIKKRTGMLFFSDINMLSKRLITDFGVPEVMFRLGETLYHFLLDEFQDTSMLQWQNLVPLIENALSQGGSLFCVGDSKQVLYRWRGSQPEVYRKGPHMLPCVSPQAKIHVVLPYNWRSCPNIIHFVSELFSRQNLELISESKNLKDNRAILDTFSTVCQRVPEQRGKLPEGLVLIRRIEGIKSADELEQMTCKWVIEVLKDIVLPRRSPQDVMILVRSNDQVERISQILLSKGIPVCSHRQLDIRQDPIVQELISLLHLVEDPWDEIHLCHLVSGQILRPVWTRYVPDSQPVSFLTQFRLKEGRENTRLLSIIRGWVPGFWDAVLKQPLSSEGYLTPYDLLSRFIRAHDIYGRFPESRVCVEHLLELVQEQGVVSHGETGAAHLISQAQDEAFMVKAAFELDAVRVMTIHKAKGLEAPVVLLPRLALDPKPSIQVEREEDGALRLLRLPEKRIRRISERLSVLGEQEEIKAVVDELNVVYVATTRAKEELYALLPDALGGHKKNILFHVLKSLFKQDEDVYVLGSFPHDTGKQKKVRDKVPGDVSGDLINEKHWDEWVWPRRLVGRATDIDYFVSPIRRAALLHGELVHQLLSLLDAPLPVEKDEQAVFSYLSESLASAFQGISRKELWGISRLICSRFLSRLFWPEINDEVWIEKEIADHMGRVYRVDRALLTHDKVLVSEFKSGSRQLKDLLQLRAYVQLLEQIFPQRKVEGLLVYTDLLELVDLEGRSWNP